MKRGRKRKAGKREKSGRPQRSSHGPDRGTQEMQDMRKTITKDQRLSPDYPLSVLLGRGLITELQHDAGMKFARNYWALFGKPFARGQDYMQPGKAGGMSAGDEMQIRAEYEAAVTALAGLGAVSLVTDLAVFLRFGWLLEAIMQGAPVIPARQVQVQRIGAALDALAALSVRRPGREARAKAEAEAS